MLSSVSLSCHMLCVCVCVHVPGVITHYCPNMSRVCSRWPRLSGESGGKSLYLEQRQITMVLYSCCLCEVTPKSSSLLLGFRQDVKISLHTERWPLFHLLKEFMSYISKAFIRPDCLKYLQCLL